MLDFFIKGEIEMTQNIKLIASDVDGTLINSEHQATEYTKEVIHRLKDHGIDFVIATGRSYDGALGVAQQLDIVEEGYGIICLNGLRTYNLPHEECVDGRTMTYEECMKMEQLGKKYHMGILYCYDDVIYFQMENIAYQDYTIGMKHNKLRFFKDRANTEEVQALSDIKHRFDANDPILKIVFVQNDDYLDLVFGRIKKEIHYDFDLLLVGHGWAEIMPKSVNKGEALIAYAASKGIKPEEIVAFGDAENDISMISRVGLGVAMENAMGSLKSVAKDITDTNDNDGVAKYIEKILENRK